VAFFFSNREGGGAMSAELNQNAATGAPASNWKPYPAYKDSGVEWMGEIPEHWEIKKFKYITENICVGFVGTIEKYYTDENGIILLKTGNIGLNKVLLDDVSYVTREFHVANKKSHLTPGDIIIARHGESGKAAVIPDIITEANCLNVVVLRKSKLMSGEFYTQVLNSNIYQQFLKASQGGSVQGIINTSDVVELKVVYPKLEEQINISNFIEFESAKIDNTVSRIEKEIELLQEYRTALISEVVTGKIDVREAI